MKKAVSLFFLYLFLLITVVTWSSVDNSMNIKLHFEYQQF